MDGRAGHRGTMPVGDLFAGFVALAGLTAAALEVGPRLPVLGITAVAALLLLWRVVAAARAVREIADEIALVGRVFEASDAVLSSLDVRRVLLAACEVGARLSRHAGAAILFVAGEDRTPVFWASWGIEPLPRRDARFAALEPHASEVLRTARALIAPLQPGLRTELNDGGRFRSACVLPLRRKSGVMGALALLSEKEPMAFQPELPTLEYYAAQAATAIDNARLYQQVQNLFLSTIKSLAAAVDAKDAYTHGHSEDIAELVAMIAQEMKLPPDEEERVRLAGLLHDIGKIGIPDAILRKPGKLDAAERAIMMTHVTLGASIIDRPGPLRDLVAIVRHHHERYDGTGYPDGLQAEAIPIGAAILAVADAFDAMTSHRAYHMAREIDTAIEELRLYAGTQFHPAVVEALVHLVERERHTGSAWYQGIESRIHTVGEGQPSTSEAKADAAEELDLVWRLGQEIRGFDDLRAIGDHLVRATVHALNCGHAALLLLDDRGQVLRVEASTGTPPRDSLLPHGRSTSWLAVERRAAQRQEDGSVVCAPLVAVGQTIGVLQAIGGGLRDPATRLLARIADAAAPSVQAALLRGYAERIATVDEVTGLLNRRALVARLQEEARRHHRYGTRFAVALGDIHGLAEFNAVHGYAAGDELIRRLGEVMAPGIRQTDLLARVDGGTFGLLMPEIDHGQAVQAVQRIQELLDDREVGVRGQFIPLPPIMWGMASCPADGTDPDALLALAEKRLHLARQRAAY